MKVVLKEPYKAHQFNPKYGIPSYVVDVLRSPDLRMLRARGYEWGVEQTDYTVAGINIGDWIITHGDEIFVCSNEQFRRDFKEVTK